MEVLDPFYGSYEWTREYDKLGRPTEEVQRVAVDDVVTATYTTLFTYAIDTGENTTSWTMTTPNGRQVVHTLDRLNRLSDAMMGQLTEDNQGIAYGQGIPAPTRTTWNLDNLGNWSGGNAGHDSVVTSVDSDGDGEFEFVRSLHHDVNGANEITAVYDSGASGPVDYRYDAAGNLVYDGTYYYQYDAWNRLLRKRPANHIAP